LYGVSPLNDAKKAADQTLTQFSEKQLGPNRERVLQARAQIIEEKANREFELGKYYEKQSYYGAARMYYTNLINEYPMTDRAKEAKTRLAAIKEKPDEPPDYLKWLRDPTGPKTK
jgi:outer membrane protein assembly factor BamD (BamD/ComL family)